MLAMRLAEALAAAHDAPVVDEAEWMRSLDSVPAAVLVAFTDRAEPGVILTRRPQWLRAHAGQVAFPGGKQDADDRDSIDTALREAEEEIGLERRHASIIGSTRPYLTGSGFRITPVLAVIPPDLAFDPNPDEVDDWFEVPATTLFDAAGYDRREAMWEGRLRSYHERDWQGRRIWGATAGIILDLADRLNLPQVLA